MNRPILASLSLTALVGAASCAQRSEESIRTAAETDRNARLLAAIREAGYRCDEVKEVAAAESVPDAWRVSCSELLLYVASLDANDALHVEPIAYDDSVPRPFAIPER